MFLVDVFKTTSISSAVRETHPLLLFLLIMGGKYLACVRIKQGRKKNLKSRISLVFHIVVSELL